MCIMHLSPAGCDTLCLQKRQTLDFCLFSFNISKNSGGKKSTFSYIILYKYSAPALSVIKRFQLDENCID